GLGRQTGGPRRADPWANRIVLFSVLQAPRGIPPFTTRRRRARDLTTLAGAIKIARRCLDAITKLPSRYCGIPDSATGAIHNGGDIAPRDVGSRLGHGAWWRRRRRAGAGTRSQHNGSGSALDQRLPDKA